ncbi:MAG: metal-dependent hydrolase [Methanomicrobiaceae archaeon]|nr:metal-dependent hydrolase [Methanomicrobiaceae archaeon]
MRLTWRGHSCFVLEGSKRVVVDPYVPSGTGDLAPDIIAVTHGHADHLGDTVALRAKTVAGNEIAKYLVAQGIDAVGLNLGGSIELDGVRFTMTPALHSGWLEEAGPGFDGGSAAGYVIRMDGVSVYHAGDTALFSDMTLIRDLYRPDVALLPIGGRYTMGPEEAMMAANFIGAPLVIPMHYNTWPAIEQDPTAFRQALERTTDIRVRVLEPGESIDLGDTGPANKKEET